ncbi:hypothetical protein BH09PAT2_BH09PAT2_07950 [soil metagenome]
MSPKFAQLSLRQKLICIAFVFFTMISFFHHNLVKTISAQSNCAKKNIGDADCLANPSGESITILDYAIWYSEFIHDCSSTNLAGCGTDADHDGNAIDANFNFPGTNYIKTDTNVDIFDYAIWIQGFLVQNIPSVTPQLTSTASPTPIVTTLPTSTPTLTISVTPIPTLTTAPSISPTQTPTGTSSKLPSQILDLTNWKITMPYDKDGNGVADEIKQPQLATFSDSQYFYVSSAGNSVIFKAHTGGANTGGSGYPRSELRERANNGTTDAAWSSSSGTHTMYIDQKINHLPAVKQHIVVGQIHDSSDDVTVFRLEGTKLFIDLGGSNGPVLTSNYQLGTRFNVKFVVTNNTIKYYYNGTLVPFTYNKIFSGAYFKAGAYTQSACQGDKKVAGETCDAYGEVEIYDVQVTHN